jgi:hypothetical protein
MRPPSRRYFHQPCVYGVLRANGENFHLLGFDHFGQITVGANLKLRREGFGPIEVAVADPHEV